MKPDEYQALDPVADALDVEFDAWVESPAMLALRKALEAAAAAMPEHFSLEVALELRVFDSKREKAIRLLTAGVTCFPGRKPYRSSGDSSSARYIVDGELCQLPHDYCPRCWGNWDFKLQHPECPECGARLGSNLKLLLDSDLCPHCEKGRVSCTQLDCNECGFRINPEFVSWG